MNNITLVILGVFLLANSTFATIVDSACLTAFKSAVLQAHNNFRTIHHVPLLVEDASLVSTAQNYAKNLSSTNTFAHSGAKGLGENLAMYGSTALPDCATLAKKFVQMWYDEVAKYDFAKATFTPCCGIAIANNKAVGVCNYSTAGNYLGQFATNVLKA
ncbi:unnamed protein product [Brachionus calyciflorus]|uniref:SCP domain-containing protein n=1 Tax=Brachionus calyciflorus TaxID=104777 RepID=A0A814N886_9BILA|nr:unnamed protein product [Brachionus calyciflorus]